jgi:hypothetical protein
MNTTSDTSRIIYLTHKEKDGLEFPPGFDWARHVARLHTLQEISRKLNSNLGLQDTLTSILDESIKACLA